MAAAILYSWDVRRSQDSTVSHDVGARFRGVVSQVENYFNPANMDPS